MYLKTTSFVFQRYGEVFTTVSERKMQPGGRKIAQIKKKEINFFYCCPEDVYIRVESGIAMVCVSNTLESADFTERFVIHKIIKINAGIYFNLMSITKEANVEFESSINIDNYKVPFKGNPIHYNRLIPSFRINEVLTCYHNVRKPNYSFVGEKHDHWELNFIDSGQLKTVIDDKEYILNEYDLILYAPNQFHSSSVAKDMTCSHLTIMFDMDTSYESQLINRIFHADREFLSLINHFVNASQVSLQLDADRMVSYLDLIIINLLQSELHKVVNAAHTPMQQKFEDELLNQIIIYINENIYSALTIEELCSEFNVSRSSLQQLFHNNLSTAPKQYISELKLNKAKLLIKESKHTISEIACILGFSSIHYFSRKFKQHFDITPTDYAKTIYS